VTELLALPRRGTRTFPLPATITMPDRHVNTHPGGSRADQMRVARALGSGDHDRPLTGTIWGIEDNRFPSTRYRERP
jgi:hypothetical protein